MDFSGFKGRHTSTRLQNNWRVCFVHLVMWDVRWTLQICESIFKLLPLSVSLPLRTQSEFSRSDVGASIRVNILSWFSLSVNLCTNHWSSSSPFPSSILYYSIGRWEWRHGDTNVSCFFLSLVCGFTVESETESFYELG